MLLHFFILKTRQKEKTRAGLAKADAIRRGKDGKGKMIGSKLYNKERGEKQQKKKNLP